MVGPRFPYALGQAYAALGEADRAARWLLDAIARPSSPSPAVGYAAKHVQQQKEVVNAALGIKE